MGDDTPADSGHAGLSHIDASGQAQMVDISDKDTTRRQAIACGSISMKPETLAAIQAGDTAKGNVLASARIAAIMAAKNTASAIPLCHPLALSNVTIDFDLHEAIQDQPAGITVQATVSCTGKTGVEMEALHAVSIGLLTIYDMAKALDKAMQIHSIHLLKKSGGRSGEWQRSK